MDGIDSIGSPSASAIVMSAIKEISSYGKSFFSSPKGFTVTIGDTSTNIGSGVTLCTVISPAYTVENQFSSIWNGRIDRCEVRDDICQLVMEELQSRTNMDVIILYGNITL